MRLVLFLSMILLFLRTYACDEILASCKALCRSDGDKVGIIIDNVCYCANPRPNTILNLGKVRGKVIIDKNRYYTDY